MGKAGIQNIRDTAIGILGAAILGYEVYSQPEPRMIVIALAAAMIGVPSALLPKRQFELPTDPPKEEVTSGRHAR